jgi:hypothetical protein
MASFFILKIAVGSTVDNNSLFEEFKGGMHRSYKTNTLVLVSKHIDPESK